MKRLLAFTVSALLLCGCGIYTLSFSGTSIEPDVNTIDIEFFEYKAQKVNPTLSNDLTEALRSQFRRMTRLEQVDVDGDLVITGEITGYDVTPQAITADEVAARNRLSVSVTVSFENRKHPEDDFSKKSFSAYSDYESTQTLDAVESSLSKEIVDKLVEDIFNATVAQW